MELVEEIKITGKKLRKLVNDNVKSAEAVNLVYSSDTDPGIRRIKKGDSFHYFLAGKKVKDAETLARIKSLVIPPAWTEVWICCHPRGHLQVTGIDIKNRKQYKYHAMWNTLRNHTKFFNLQDFGKTLPAIRQRLQEDLALAGLPQEKVLAAAVSLMQCTCIRVGNN
ncbi:MAG: DNA topoisomerase IB, partial [Chitinophagaceae bacterium]